MEKQKILCRIGGWTILAVPGESYSFGMGGTRCGPILSSEVSDEEWGNGEVIGWAIAQPIDPILPLLEKEAVFDLRKQFREVEAAIGRCFDHSSGWNRDQVDQAAAMLEIIEQELLGKPPAAETAVLTPAVAPMEAPKPESAAETRSCNCGSGEPWTRCHAISSYCG